MAVCYARRRLDDDDVFDAELYDPAYYPRKVFRDGKGPTVRLALTDSAPPRRALFDANAHRITPWSTPPIRTSGPPRPPIMNTTSGFRTRGVGRVHGLRLPRWLERTRATPTSCGSAARGRRCRTFLRVLPMMTTIRRRRLPPLRRSALAGMQRARRRTRRSQIGTSPMTSISTTSRTLGRGPAVWSQEGGVDDKACRGAGRADRCGLLR